MLLLVAPAGAQEIEYTDVDRATVRVLALDAVDTYEIVQNGQRLVLASPAAGHGSGFAVTRDGLVVTAAHVVAGARAVLVHVPDVSRAVAARVVHIDAVSDVAILKVAHEFSSPALLSSPDQQLEIRSEVFAVGYPLDVTRADPQSARGVLSGRLPDGRLQLDISLNPGNSGGPVIDADDRVVGIVSARSDVGSGAIGLAAAVPVEAFRGVIERFRQRSDPAPEGSEAQKLAELVSLVAHEGETLVRGSVRHDSAHAQRVERELGELLDDLPTLADAALLGAVFFWNRHVALRVQGADARPAHERALELVGRAVELDPTLEHQSEFVRWVRVSGSTGPSTALAARALLWSAVRVRFESPTAGISLSVKRVSRSGSDESDTAPFGRICTAPCEQDVVIGTYQAALSKGDGELVVLEQPLEIAGPVTVQGRYRDFGALRTVGWLVTFGGPAVGIGLGSYSEERCSFDESSGSRSCRERRPHAVPGLLLAAGSLTLGLVLTTRRDEASLTLTSGVQSKPLRGEVEHGAHALEGLTVSGTF